MSEHYVHEHFRVTTTFTDVAGDNADPSVDVEYVIIDPGGTVTEYTYTGAEITKASTGVFYRDILPDEHGEWIVWVKGEGSLDTIEKEVVTVRKSRDELA